MQEFSQELEFLFVKRLRDNRRLLKTTCRSYLFSKSFEILQQILLRQVCTHDRPKGAKPLQYVSLNCLWSSRFPLPAAKAAASFCAASLLLVSPTFATENTGWRSVSSTTTWQSRDAFGAATSASAHGNNTRRFVLNNGQDDKLDQLLSMIAREEGPKGYNAVNHQARVKPPKPPVQMTVAEIFKWIGDTPGQQHAIGRYQIIPKTLTRLVAKLNVSHRTIFDAALQNRMGRALAREAGYDAFVKGTMEADVFMDKLAGVWAALPAQNGRSVYHSIAGNRATISRAKYRARMASIFPQIGASK